MPLKYLINESVEGFANWMTVHEADSITKLHCVEFSSTMKGEDVQTSHRIMASKNDLRALAESLNYLSQEDN